MYNYGVRYRIVFCVFYGRKTALLRKIILSEIGHKRSKKMTGNA